MICNAVLLYCGNGIVALLQQCDGGSVSDRDLVLLYIEKQAVVQVMIMVLAQHLDLKKDSKINVVRPISINVHSIMSPRARLRV